MVLAIRLLKALARLPIASDTWLGFGHTMDNEEDFAKDTKLCAAILTGPRTPKMAARSCILPSGEEVKLLSGDPPSTGMNWNISWPMTRTLCWTK